MSAHDSAGYSPGLVERYILGTSRTEQKRLLEQGALFEAEGRWLLDEIGVEPENEAEPNVLVDAVRRHVGTSGTFVLQPLLVQAWGRTPP